MSHVWAPLNLYFNSVLPFCSEMSEKQNVRWQILHLPKSRDLQQFKRQLLVAAGSIGKILNNL
jgi:hypothetical protein